MNRPHDLILDGIAKLRAARALIEDRPDVDGDLTQAIWWATNGNEKLKADKPAEPHMKPPHVRD